MAEIMVFRSIARGGICSSEQVLHELIKLCDILIGTAVVETKRGWRLPQPLTQLHTTKKEIDM